LPVSAHVTVRPEQFSFVAYDANEIAEIVVDIAERLGLTNPIVVEVDETTPLGKVSSRITGSPSSDATITLTVQSGALEDTRHLQTFSAARARRSIGRGLLRARDRLRPDFAETPADTELTNAQTTAWDAYSGGRLERLGLEPIKQQYRYDFRNRFGFTDNTDRLFDQLWSADDLAWTDLPTPMR
jgi:hypothetical protein